MIVLWTIIVVLTPFSPPVSVFERLCLEGGGKELRVNQGTVRNEATGQIHRTITIHCIPENTPEKKKIRT